MAERHQVVIVGGGPVGIALAVSLGMRGITCALVESRTEMHRIPKGQNLTQRTLEHFYFWGIADELRKARVAPADAPLGELTAYGNLASDYWQTPRGRELVRPYYFQDNDRMPQYAMEAVLRKKLASLRNVDARFGWTATGVAQDADGVRATVTDPQGAEHVLHGDYLVGCDGGNSLVREASGIERSGTDFDQLMVLVVFRSRDLHEKLKRFPLRTTYRVLHPDFKGYWQFFGRIDLGEGFFFHAPIPKNTKRENYDFRAPLFRATGFAFDFDIDYAGFWQLRNAVAHTYRNGRIFIAGDAAHTHPPYGGFGLNNGLEDAVNLGWKLAARLQGWGGDALLDSYSLEREPVFRDIAEHFIAERIAEEADFLARYNPQRDRAEFERAWAGRESDLGKRVHRYEPNYEGSPVVCGPQGGVTGAQGDHSFLARAGHHLAPQNGVYESLWPHRMGIDIAAAGFTLLAVGDQAPDVVPLRDAAAARAIPLATVCMPDPRLQQAYGCKLILVRPDQFVAWCGDSLPGNPAALLDKVTGRDTQT